MADKRTEGGDGTPLTLMRVVNCYYSNLIEGRAPELEEIDRALEGEYLADRAKRNLQVEARAHVEVQLQIDHGKMPYPATSQAGVCWIHQQYYLNVPEDHRWVTSRQGTIRAKLVPGATREREIRVGGHEPPPYVSIPAMQHRFAKAYAGPMVTPMQRLIGVGASHHRLVWIHPFLDGNGRVGRLMSHARLRELGLGSELWSISRGLARKVDEYRLLLRQADMVSHYNRGGPGNLSASGLSAFTLFFLTTAVDQVQFMSLLLNPRELRQRIERWTREEVDAGRLMAGSWPILRAVLSEGEISRGRAPELSGYADRQARTVLSGLTKRKLLVSDTEKGPVRLGFPTDVVGRWFPGLRTG